MQPEIEEKKSNGALVGSIIIVVILIIGAVYIWREEARNIRERKNLELQNTSAINANLNNTETTQ